MDTTNAAHLMWYRRYGRLVLRLLTVPMVCLTPAVRVPSSWTPTAHAVAISNVAAIHRCEQLTLVAAAQTLTLGGVHSTVSHTIMTMLGLYCE